MVSSATVTGWCQGGDCARCDGTLRAGTGWNWWCTCACHPEPVLRVESNWPALDFWRTHRQAEQGESRSQLEVL